jgi:hypothetical protein
MRSSEIMLEKAACWYWLKAEAQSQQQDNVDDEVLAIESASSYQRSRLCSTYASSAGVTLGTRGWAAGLMAAREEPTANRKYGECDQVMAGLEHHHSSCTCAGVLQTKGVLLLAFRVEGKP